jgi:site-specific recombinase XerD
MSALSQHLAEYLALRRSLGHRLADAARLLPRFVAYLEARGAEFVTLEAALAWSLEPEAPAGSTVWGKRMMAVRGFARYLSGIDPRTEVPPAGTIPVRRRWRPPFIYSEADIVALIEEAGRSIPQPLRTATYKTLIGLLAATGLRIGEAIRLDHRDVDFCEGVLLVRESKFGKSRQVPLGPGALQALEGYARRREELCPHPSSESFSSPFAGRGLSMSPSSRRSGCSASALGSVAERRAAPAYTISATPSRCAPCSAGTAMAMTSRPAYRGFRPTSGIENPVTPTTTSRRRRSFWDTPRGYSSTTKRWGHDPDRPDAAGVLHRPHDPPDAGQPRDDRLLP